MTYKHSLSTWITHYRLIIIRDKYIRVIYKYPKFELLADKFIDESLIKIEVFVIHLFTHTFNRFLSSYIQS